MALELRAKYCWDGETGRSDRPVAVRVEGERIARVGEGDGAADAAPAETLDFGEATILPGLIDMHTHLGIDHQTGDIRAQMRDPAVRHILAGACSLRRDLHSGVTTAKLNGDREFFDIQMRDAIRDGLAEGPRLHVSGRGIKSSRCTGGVVATAILDDPEAICRAVDENLAAGADWIKLFSSGNVFGALEEVLQPFYGHSQLAAAAQKAHAAGKRMSSHCFGGEAADACLAAGVDVIDHGWLLTERQQEAMAARGTWLCPTVGVLAHPDGVPAYLPADRRDAARRRIDEVLEVTRAALRIGVPLLAGTDAMHGGLPGELALLQELGGRPEALLRAATCDAAEVLGLAGELGVLREGATADLVVVRGNALQDVRRLAEVLLVVQAGRIVRRAQAEPESGGQGGEGGDFGLRIARFRN
jgi:imidazolonepropionase-like amidohydrolase